MKHIIRFFILFFLIHTWMSYGQNQHINGQRMYITAYLQQGMVQSINQHHQELTYCGHLSRESEKEVKRLTKEVGDYVKKEYPEVYQRFLNTQSVVTFQQNPGDTYLHSAKQQIEEAKKAYTVCYSLRMHPIENQITKIRKWLSHTEALLSNTAITNIYIVDSKTVEIQDVYNHYYYAHINDFLEVLELKSPDQLARQELSSFFSALFY